MRVTLTTTIITLLLLSCTSRYKYWEVNKFDIDPKALSDEEEVKVIYTSRGPNDNLDLTYFIHLIVVSQKSGDTVNVLTTADNGFEEYSGDKVFNYFSQENEMAKLVHADLQNIKEISDLDKLKPIDVSRINKVARDPDYDYLADNTYPSIIGWIGTTGKVAP